MKKFTQLYLDSYRGLSPATWMLALIILINRTGAMVLPFLGIYMTNALGFSLKETGIVLSFFGIGAVLGSLFGGWLTDKIGHFKVQLFSLVLSLPLFFLLPEFKNSMSLSAGILLLSFITETFRPANSVALTSYAKKQNVTRAFSLNRMAINLGFSIGPALGGLLAAISFNLLFYGNGLSVGIAAVVFYYFFRNRKKINTLTEEVENTKVKGKSPWKDHHFMIFSLLCCLYSIAFFQLLSTLPLFYREVHLLNEWDIGLLLAYSGLVVFSLEMFIVHLAERKLNSTWSIVLGSLLLSLSFILLNMNDSMWMLYLSMFVLCLSEILAMPFMAAVSIKRASKNRRGAYMGINSLAFSAAHILSPILGTGFAAMHGFENLWWATGILSVFTATGLYFIMKKMNIA